MKKFHLSSIALIVGSIALSGCAAKALSPELDEARKTYQSAISDPIVASLAGPELELAEKQLQVAEEAAEFFKAEEVIAHEATLQPKKTFNWLKPVVCLLLLRALKHRMRSHPFLLQQLRALKHRMLSHRFLLQQLRLTQPGFKTPDPYKAATLQLSL